MGVGERLIYLAPAANPEELLETLSHEMAHALVPWREGHTARWLGLHVATLELVAGPETAARVAVQDRARYGLG